jgi:hypothetical protein
MNTASITAHKIGQTVERMMTLKQFNQHRQQHRRRKDTGSAKRRLLALNRVRCRITAKHQFRMTRQSCGQKCIAV